MGKEANGVAETFKQYTVTSHPVICIFFSLPTGSTRRRPGAGSSGSSRGPRIPKQTRSLSVEQERNMAYIIPHVSNRNVLWDEMEEETDRRSPLLLIAVCTRRRQRSCVPSLSSPLQRVHWRTRIIVGIMLTEPNADFASSTFNIQ